MTKLSNIIVFILVFFCTLTIYIYIRLPFVQIDKWICPNAQMDLSDQSNAPHGAVLLAFVEQIIVNIFKKVLYFTKCGGKMVTTHKNEGEKNES